MNAGLIVLLAAVGAGLWKLSSDEADEYEKEQKVEVKDVIDEILEEQCYEMQRSTRGLANQISTWRDEWELPSGNRPFRVEFTVDKGDRGGFLVALARKWKDVSAGGLGIVIDDNHGSGAPGVDSSTYFVDMPHWDRPRQSSSILHNHTLKRPTTYWMRYDGAELTFGTGGNLFLRTPVPQDRCAMRYLAFGSLGDDLNCTGVTPEERHFARICNVSIE